MIKKYIYQAKDGKTFTHKAACEEYEHKLSLMEDLIDTKCLFFADINHEIKHSFYDKMNAYIICIHKDEDAKELMKYANTTGARFPFICENKTPKAGVYVCVPSLNFLMGSPHKDPWFEVDELHNILSELDAFKKKVNA